MNHLLSEWTHIKDKVKDKIIFLFLDYDGTLAEIADHPDKAVLSDELASSLRSLSNNKQVRIAVISGRGLPDIRQKVGLENIIYSGNHGLEIEGPGLRYSNLVPPVFLYALPGIKKSLVEALIGYKGSFIEDKKLTLSIHYRLSKQDEVPEILKTVRELLKEYVDSGLIILRDGKKIIEVVPQIPWNKGLAVKWILHHPELSSKKYLPVYIGDDITDEDAFDALKDIGISVLVGEREGSKARYFVHNVTEVGKFIQLLQDSL